MTSRTAAALAAIAAKRAIPDGWVSIQTTIALPSELVDRWRSATPTDRGWVVEIGVSTIEHKQNLRE